MNGVSTARAQAFDAATSADVDVAVIGGGVSGAAVYRALSRRGYRVLVVDRGDFGGGTSQASGMLVWGGLLYLASCDLRAVWTLCRARDRLVRRQANDVETMRFRYLPLKQGGRQRWLVKAALELYWLLGRGQRQRPYSEGEFANDELLRDERFASSLVYEEARLRSSDSRLVLRWITSRRDDDRIALNHCALDHATWDEGIRRWQLELTDRRSGRRVDVRARMVVNAGGVWADHLASTMGLRTRHRHVFSKGVYMALPRPPSLDEGLAFEMGQHSDTQTFTPWGPVALWGPTETAHESLDAGFQPDADDVRFLVNQANRNLRSPYDASDIVSLRCGLRPLAVKQSYSAHVHPLALSRRHVIDLDRHLPALTIYGGKITSAPLLGRRAARLVAQTLRPTGAKVARSKAREMPRVSLLGAEVPDPAYCAEYEACVTLDDFLRRRTNLSQWIPRLGLGRDDSNLDTITSIAARIEGAARAPRAVEALRASANAQDALLASA